MKHYTHLAIEDKSKAVERLPVYGKGIGLESQKKTGTDDRGCIGGVPGGDEGAAESGVPGGDRRQTHHGRNCHSDVTIRNEISEKQPLEGSGMGSLGMVCHQTCECPGEDLNLHVPKDTSPSS